MATKFAPGAAFKSRKILPTIIASHTLPDIQQNTIVIGICGTDIASASPSDEGWFLSDFCAFNYLLKGVGMKQTWMTTISEADLLDFIRDPENKDAAEGFMHGNPFRERKIVFNQSLVDRQELTKFTVSTCDNIVPNFLEELRLASQLAKHSTPVAPILILMFGHGLESLEIVLNYGVYDPAAQEFPRGLKLDLIKQTIPPGIPATIITTACFSGGFAIQPDLNMSVLTAAGALDPSRSLSNEEKQRETWLSKAWPCSASIGRACGSIFASSLINTLSASTTPLLETPAAHTAESGSLQPAEPTAAQTDSYNAFCASIVDRLKDITRIPAEHEFRFAAEDDEWDLFWMKRSGIPLAYFQKRWSLLEVYHPTYTSVLDLYPRDSDDEGAKAPTGGVRGPTGRPENITRRIMQIKAKMLADACPGDWNAGPYLRLRGQLRRYAAGEPKAMAMETYLQNIIIYRVDAANFVDSMVLTFRLPRPYAQNCLAWQYDRYWNENKVSDARCSQILDHLSEAGLTWEGRAIQGGQFRRGYYYLAATMNSSDYNMVELKCIVEAIASIFEGTEQYMKKQLIKDRTIRDRARRWLSTLGKRSRAWSAVSP